MYGGEAPYGQHQPSSGGGRPPQQPTSGAYGYAAPQQQSNYGYAPPAATAPTVPGYGGASAPSAYGGYDPAYGNPGMGGSDAPGGYGDRHWAGPHHEGSGGGGRGGGGGSGGPRFAAVRLRGLPFGVREYEIAVFLVGIYTIRSPFFSLFSLIFQGIRGWRGGKGKIIFIAILQGEGGHRGS